MNEQEWNDWLAVTNASESQWVVDLVTWLNRGERLAYYGGTDGVYVRVSKDCTTVEVGTYTGALPHIGDAVFRPRLTYHVPSGYSPERMLIMQSSWPGADIGLIRALIAVLPAPVARMVRRNALGRGSWACDEVALLRQHQRKAGVGIPDDEPLDGAFATSR